MKPKDDDAKPRIIERGGNRWQGKDCIKTDKDDSEDSDEASEQDDSVSGKDGTDIGTLILVCFDEGYIYGNDLTEFYRFVMNDMLWMDLEDELESAKDLSWRYYDTVEYIVCELGVNGNPDEDLPTKCENDGKQAGSRKEVVRLMLLEVWMEMMKGEHLVRCYALTQQYVISTPMSN
ncbi:hypothetical protein Tco_1294066 [Tanacetum coccineum]